MKKQNFKKLEKKSYIWKRIIRFHIFNDYSPRSIEETILRVEKYKGVIQNYIKYLQISIDRINKEYGFKSDAFKIIRGADSHGYNSINEINATLNYISDRFSVGLNLQWLLDLSEGYKSLNKNEQQ